VIKRGEQKTAENGRKVAQKSPRSKRQTRKKEKRKIAEIFWGQAFRKTLQEKRRENTSPDF